MSISHINSSNRIDCADDIHRVINATLGGEFRLYVNGSFTLHPCPAGLTPMGEEFMTLAKGRCYANLLSVIAVIMDLQVENQQVGIFERATRDGLACPFCDQVSAHEMKVPIGVGVTGWCVECSNCGARGPGGYADKVSARAGWAGLDRTA